MRDGPSTLIARSTEKRSGSGVRMSITLSPLSTFGFVIDRWKTEYITPLSLIGYDHLDG